MVKQLYPTCYKSFNKWISSNKNYQNVYELVKPRIFDVSLRDGLQSIKKEEQEKYSTKIKTELYNNILNKYKHNIDKPFFECDSWTWFPIKNFTNNNNFVQAPHYKNIFHETYIIVNDIFNNPKFISSRTWKILLQSYNKQGIKGINLCYKIIKNINNFKLHNKGYNTTILPLLQNIPITSIYIS